MQCIISTECVYNGQAASRSSIFAWKNLRVSLSMQGKESCHGQLGSLWHRLLRTSECACGPGILASLKRSDQSLSCGLILLPHGWPRLWLTLVGEYELINLCIIIFSINSAMQNAPIISQYVISGVHTYSNFSTS